MEKMTSSKQKRKSKDASSATLDISDGNVKRRRQAPVQVAEPEANFDINSAT